MHYDNIKRPLGNFFNKTPFLRILFYNLLDLLLLRTWHVQKYIKKWATDKKDKHMHILDAGAGFGQYTYFLSKLSKKWTILSVDVKEEQVCDCNTFFRKIDLQHILFQTANLVTFKQENAFDLIVNVDVMEHIVEDTQVLQNFYDSLKPGGMLIISTPSDQGGSDVDGENDSSFIEEHVRDGYNKAELCERLKKIGFSKVKGKYTYWHPGHISWILSMKIPMKLLGISKILFVLLPFYYLITFPISFILNWMDTNLPNKEGTGTGLLVRAWK
jgi:SAM-dependent methyltransferase